LGRDDPSDVSAVAVAVVIWLRFVVDKVVSVRDETSWTKAAAKCGMIEVDAAIDDANLDALWYVGPSVRGKGKAAKGIHTASDTLRTETIDLRHDMC
jgi:hypothetical protein